MFEYYLEILRLFPLYLVILSFVLVIIPTLICFILRFFLYLHLESLISKIRRLLRGERKDRQPRLIENIEYRLQQVNEQQEKVNTIALIEGAYSQEFFRVIGFPFRCESVNYFTRTLPNLLLAFGLLGTFLGITINLTSLSQTLNQVNLTDVNSLVAALNTPLQGMGIAFITSLIAITCSAFLTFINLIWNTSLSKIALINLLEDYCDNIYLPQISRFHPLQDAIQGLTTKIEQSFSYPLGQLIEVNKTTNQLTAEVYQRLVDSFNIIDSLEKSASSFEKSAQVFERSRFAEKLSSATADLAIAQNQFSQSSLVLSKSTQSFEQTLESLEKQTERIIQLGKELSSLNERYTSLVSIIQKRNVIEEAGLSEIKIELANLVDKMRKQ